MALRVLSGDVEAYLEEIERIRPVDALLCIAVTLSLGRILLLRGGRSSLLL